MKDGYAYDQVANEDVRINNCMDIPHDFDVQEAVQNEEAEYGHEPTQAIAKEHPRLISASLSHDPSEGCQGSFTEIVEEDCPFCGYDRARESVETMAGLCYLTCNRCGSAIGGDAGEHPPTLERDRVDQLKRHADVDGPVCELGRAGGTHTLFGQPGSVPVYGYSDTKSLIKWVDNGSVHAIRTKHLANLCDVVADAGYFTPTQCATLLSTIVEAMVDDEAIDELRPAERAIMAAVLLPDGFTTGLNEDREE